MFVMQGDSLNWNTGVRSTTDRVSQNAQSTGLQVKADYRADTTARLERPTVTWSTKSLPFCNPKVHYIKTARHWALSRAKLIHSTTSYDISFKIRLDILPSASGSPVSFRLEFHVLQSFLQSMLHAPPI